MFHAIRQQAITWANVGPDLCCNIVSPGHNELTHWGPEKMANILQTFSNVSSQVLYFY